MTTRLRLKPWMPVSAAWLLPALFAAITAIGQAQLNGWDAPTARELLFSSGDWFLYAFVTPLVFMVSARWPIVRPHSTRRILLHLAFSLLFCVMWASLGKVLQALLALIFVPDAWHNAMAAGSDFTSKAFRDLLSWIMTTIPFGVGVYLGMVGIEHAIRYFTEAREHELQVARLSSQLTEARLAALQAQINPHFLFNALNTIAVHARDGDSAGTARIVEQLSDLLRRSLGRNRAIEGPLEDELDLVRQYLAIEQARFPDRLRHHFAIEDATRAMAVPGFMVQHLVENAVRHGIAPRSGSGTVRIGARRDGDALVVSVSDDGLGFDPGHVAPPGHGLENTRARLQTLYDDRASLTISRNPGGGMTTEIRLPWHEATVGEVDAEE